MSEYRLLHIQADGDGVDAEEFFATSDETAINYAAARAGRHGCELWSRDRLVALVTREEPTGLVARR